MDLVPTGQRVMGPHPECEKKGGRGGHAALQFFTKWEANVGAKPRQSGSPLPPNRTSFLPIYLCFDLFLPPVVGGYPPLTAPTFALHLAKNCNAAISGDGVLS
jgi:hypothetical protein